MLVDRRDNNDDLSHEYFEFDKNVRFRYIRFTNQGKFPANGKVSISGLRVFGPPQGELPENAPEFQAVRDVNDARNMTVTWKAVPGAQGYFVRFGVKPGELYTQYQIIGECKADIRCLIRDVNYYVTVDAYSEGGIVKGVDRINV